MPEYYDKFMNLINQATAEEYTTRIYHQLKAWERAGIYIDQITSEEQFNAMYKVLAG